MKQNDKLKNALGDKNTTINDDHEDNDNNILDSLPHIFLITSRDAVLFLHGPTGQFL